MNKKSLAKQRICVLVKKHRIRQSLQNDSSESDSEIAQDYSSSKEPNLREANVSDFGSTNSEPSSNNFTENIEVGNAEGEEVNEEDERRQNVVESEAESSDSEAEVDLPDDEEVDVLVENDAEPEIQQLQEWAIETQIKQEALDELLNILRVRLLTDLPKSSKTFLK